MSLSKEKKDLNASMMLITVLILIIIILNWSLELKLWLPYPESFLYVPLLKFYHIFDNKMIFVRIAFILGVLGYSWFTPSIKIGKKIKDDDVNTYLFLSLLTISVILIGTINFYFYDLIVLPVALLFLAYPSAVYFSKRKNELADDLDFFKKVSYKKNKEDDLSLKIPTDKGKMLIHNPNQGIKIIGGPGSGKTVLLQFLINDLLEKGYCGVLYDYEGNPDEYREGAKENPLVLTRQIYTTLKELNEKVDDEGFVNYKYGVANKSIYRDVPVKFAFLNFIDPTRSVRVNPLSIKYHPNRISLRSIIEIFLKAVDLELVKKTDFWAKNGISYTQAIAIRLYKEYPDLLTIPHLVSFLLADYNKVLQWLAEDPELERAAATIMTSYNAKAEGQLAGSTSSGQAPVQKLYDPNIYWVLSPKPEEEFNMNVTDKENPRFFCVGNAPQYSGTLSAPISVILNVCMKNMNQLGKRKSAFIVEEFPTVTFNPEELSQFPATARKKLVVLILVMKDVSQAISTYGKEKWDIIKNTIVNTFIGRNENDDLAKSFAQAVGKHQKKKVSYTTSDSSISESESKQWEDILQPREVKGQPTGHFMGQIADGDPPMFSAQFPFYEKKSVDPLPVFSKKFNTGNEKQDRDIMENLIKKNFERIDAEVDSVLAGYLVLEKTN